MNTTARDQVRCQRAGGVAALYLALAYIAAMPYFLLVVDYPGASTTALKVALVVDNYSSMYAMYVATYVLFGIALAVLVLALYERLSAAADFTARIATAVGLLWSFALVACGMVFTYGMTAVVESAKSDPQHAQGAWRAIEPVAMGLGGAGGEILGGLWVLLVSLAALRRGALPKALNWLGVVIGVAGIASVVPPIHDAAYAFGLLQIAWFVWLGLALIRTKATAQQDRKERETAEAGLVPRPGTAA